MTSLRAAEGCGCRLESSGIVHCPRGNGCASWTSSSVKLNADRAASLPRYRAISLLTGYLDETQKRSLGHMRRFSVYEPNQFMILDPFTRRNLELTETVRDRSKKGSLLWLLDRTRTSMGARLLRRWIDKPLA